MSATKGRTPPTLSPTDIDVPVDEPRVKDVRLGERLGMAQPLNIRKSIEANAEELGRYGSIHAVRELIEHGKGGRREITVYYLNEAQALLLCLFSRTKRAADVRQEVIEAFLGWRRGADGACSRTSLLPPPPSPLPRAYALVGLRMAVDYSSVNRWAHRLSREAWDSLRALGAGRMARCIDSDDGLLLVRQGERWLAVDPARAPEPNDLVLALGPEGLELVEGGSARSPIGTVVRP